MPIAIITYTYVHLNAPETVRDFLSSDLMQEYCAGSTLPMIMTPIDAESLDGHLPSGTRGR